MSNIDPAAPAAPVPAPAPQTTPASGGDQKPDALAVTTETTAPSDEQPAADAGAEQEKRDEAKRRRRDTAQERINELTADKRRLERENDQFRETVLRGQQPKPVDATTSTDLVEPREADFTDYGEYLKKRDDYLVERTRRAVAKENDEKTKASEAKRSFDERKAKALDARQRFDKAAETVAPSYEDFDDVMDDLWDPNGTKLDFMRNDNVAEFIIEHAERGPELVYHLNANPKEAKRIAALTSPIAITRELTRLEASLPKPKARSVTNAPAPPKELGGKGGTDKPDPEKMSIDEYRKFRKTEKVVT